MDIQVYGLHLFNVEDEWLGPIVEAYDGTVYLGRIAYRFDAQSPAYYYEPAESSARAQFLCWQEDEGLAVNRFKRRYYAARRRTGL